MLQNHIAVAFFFTDVDSLLATYRIVPNIKSSVDVQQSSPSFSRHRQDSNIEPVAIPAYRHGYHLPVRYAGAECRHDGIL